MKKCIKLLCSILFVSILSSAVFAETDTDETIKQNETKADEMASVQLAMSNPEYLVTPGDIYNLSYAAGSTGVTYDIVVDSSYKVRVSNLAVIDAKGKTFPELKATVENIVSKNYPMSGVQLVLTNPSTFKVIITGEVRSTVEVNAWSLTRISTFLNYGQNTNYTSTRFITVTSADGKSTTYDLFLAGRNGDFSQNPYVRPGDVITLNRADRKVTISGGVERAGTYELKEGENLKALVEYYGNGLTELADTSRIEITRYINEEPMSGKKYYLNAESLTKDFSLTNKDSVYISDFTSLSQAVFFEGAVTTSDDTGTDLNASSRVAVNINENTNLAFLIRNYKKYFSNPQADLQNAYVIRGTESIPLDIEKILYDPSYYVDVIAQPNDKVVVPFRQFFVTVAGSVVSPGRYPYIPDRTYDYYVGLAGGFVKSQNSGGKVKITDINGNAESVSEFITPESTITAATNSFTYYFNYYSPIVTTILSLVTTTITLTKYFEAK